MKRSYTFISLILTLTLLSGVVLASSKVSADNDSVVDEVTITVPVSCTMSSAIATGQDHTASLSPGTYSAATGSDYVNGIGKTTLTVMCNDYNGFSIYAVGYTGDTIGTNTLNGTVASGNATIATGVYTQGDTTSSWSMKVDKVTDSSVSYNPNNMTIATDTEGVFNSWHSVPSSYTKVAEYHASTGSSATDTTLGAKVETTYAAYISQTQPADTYIGKVKYTMVHPYTEEPLSPQQATAGCINYFANASDAVGTMGCQSASDGSSITLLASNFSRAGYGFAGWSDAYDYATNQNAKFYGPNETITAPTGTTANGLSLYAVWVKSAGSLQDTSKVATLCGTGTGSLTAAPTDGTANLASVSALTDQRDNNTYAIAKLADGKCWMIENLRLDNTATLTLANTNNPLNDGTNVTLKHNYSDTTTYNTLSATSSVVYNADTAPDGWCTSDSAACDNQSRLRTDNTVSRATNPTSNSGSMYSYGNYYNWYSATAGRGTYSKSSGEVEGDLCPSGWKLPYGNSSGNGNTPGGFYYLNYKLNNDSNVTNSTASANLRKYPTNILYSGYVSGGSLSTRGSSGRYWSSTASDNYYAYSLSLTSSGVNPGTHNRDKYYGMTLRCVAGS